MSSLGWLRRQAVGWSLPRRGGGLATVLAELELVQADPIRAPARAQDLILRQRVTGYRVGDLDRRYRSLDIDEDMLYAYGFTARGLRRTNAWGGTSSATTMEPDRLRHYGLLRVADRIGGVRRYELAEPLGDPVDPAERLRTLVVAVARLLAPATESTLSTAVSHLALWAGRPHGRPGGLPVIRDLLARGELTALDVEGTRYVWPSDLIPIEAACPGAGTVPGAVRPGRLGPATVRAAVGMGVPVRGVHAGCPAAAGILRHAAAVARPGHRLGHLRRRRGEGGLRRIRANRPVLCGGADCGDRAAEAVPQGLGACAMSSSRSSLVRDGRCASR